MLKSRRTMRLSLIFPEQFHHQLLDFRGTDEGVVIAAELGPLALAIEDVNARDAADAQFFVHQLLRFVQDQVGYVRLEFCQQFKDLFFSRSRGFFLLDFVQAYGNAYQAVFAILLLHLDHVRVVINARDTPGCPEIDDDHLVAVFQDQLLQANVLDLLDGDCLFLGEATIPLRKQPQASQQDRGNGAHRYSFRNSTTRFSMPG